MNAYHDFFAPCPRGASHILCRELERLGISGAREQGAGARFSANLEQAYQALLYSRVASRLLLTLAEFPAAGQKDLYEGAWKLPWEEHFGPDGLFRIDADVSRKFPLPSFQASLVVKDALVDRFRHKTGKRPSVDKHHPEISLHLGIRKGRATVSLDLAGASLHQRGYREDGALAPIKENLAATVLYLAGWPETAKNQGPLVDLFCGSGTFLVEGAWMAGRIAPGLLRDKYGSVGWKGHDTGAWRALGEEARARAGQGLRDLPPILGADRAVEAVNAARANIQRASLEGKIKVVHQSLEKGRNPLAPAKKPGLVVVNPPYGERLGQVRDLSALYRRLGQVLMEHYPGFRASVLTANPELCRHMGLRALRFHKLYNGSLECRLFHFEVTPDRVMKKAPVSAGFPPEGRAPMFRNRVKKNLKKLTPWAKKNNISCFRVYAGDIPEYNLEVDIYQGEKTWAHVLERPRPRSLPRQKAQTRLADALSELPGLFGIPGDQVMFKERLGRPENLKKNLEPTRDFHQVREGGLNFLVNFTDYLDTGLPLRLRLVREKIRELARDRDCLSLFAGNGSLGLCALAGNARSCLFVENSARYLDWARENLKQNRMDGKKVSLVKQRPELWVEQAAIRQEHQNRYHLIFLCPPTHFREEPDYGTKRLFASHAALLNALARLLAPDGRILYALFSKKKFLAEIPGLWISDISQETLPLDFLRETSHQCFLMGPKP